MDAHPIISLLLITSEFRLAAFREPSACSSQWGQPSLHPPLPPSAPSITPSSTPLVSPLPSLPPSLPHPLPL